MRASSAAILLALAACTAREPDTRPFHVSATRADGTALGAGLTAPLAIVLDGTGRRPANTSTTLVVEGATLADGTAVGDVTLAFHADAARDVAFPPQLDGQRVNVVVLTDPAQLGPFGEALPVPGLRIATGTPPDLHHQFLLAEFAYDGGETTNVFAVGPVTGTEDIPFFQVVADWSEFEPSRCGPVYYDFLQVYGETEIVTLRRGERREIQVGAGLADWKVLHVLSWHRGKACENRAKAWTQMAAWR